jgi:AcrR family transcriptional regulator
MDETRIDARVERSRAQLTAALSELARERPAAQVSVSALCAAAGVSRPTFYQHFSSVDDVLTALLDERLARVSVGSDDDHDVPATLTRFLGEIVLDRPAYQALLAEDGLANGPGETLRVWMARRLADHFGFASAAEARVVYASAGAVAVIAAWLRDPDAEDETAMAERLWALTTSVLGTPGAR